MKRKAETKTGVRHRLKIKKESYQRLFLLLLRKFLLWNRWRKWFSEVGSWLLRIRIMGAGFFNALGKGLWQDMDYLFFRISDVWVFNGWDRVLTGYGLGRGFLRFRIQGLSGELGISFLLIQRCKAGGH